MARIIIGILLIALFAVAVVGGLAYVHGWKITLIALGISILLTAILVIGLYLIIK